MKKPWFYVCSILRFESSIQPFLVGVSSAFSQLGRKIINIIVYHYTAFLFIKVKAF
jgi:uncharacterized membrane protein